MSVHAAAVSRKLRGSDRTSEVVDSALEARAHNLRQQRLIHNATPEIDSLVEHVVALARAASPEQRAHLAAILGIVKDLAHSNHQEGELERAVAGAAERMAADARERRMREALGVKAIARALRDPLDVLARPQSYSASRYAVAAQAINDVMDRVPAAKLLALSVRHELGVRKFSQLAALVESRGQVAA